jgi:predicted glycoside hydrolase/deacetylase ChbG (UPF0249 family)
MLMSRYTKIFSSLPAGSSEIICHPGYKDSGLNAVAHEMGKFYLNEERDTELNALLRPELKSLAKKLNISLVSYKNLT